ncbi:carboxypeptidase A1-like [Penaeus monodon]|uniref:carboxypeptidase A1-like n=1 Tax=Penaeus monodon TaxID=6687 RepID=UPI0018A6D5B3|nr:carboxypeptidase A1-like [Penaeus monodon]
MKWFVRLVALLCSALLLLPPAETSSARHPPTPSERPPDGGAEGPQADPRPRDYAGWKLLRIFPSSPSLLKAVVASLRNNTKAVVVQVSQAELLADVGLSPRATLESVLSASLPPPRPPLCSLDALDTAHAVPGTEGQTRAEQELDECQGGEESPAEEMSLTARKRRFSLDLLKWKTLPGFVKEKPKLDGSEALAWDDYYRYDSIQRFGQNLSRSLPHVEYLDIGKSFEGRPLFALCFASKPTSMAKIFKKKLLKIRRLRAKRGRDPELAVLQKRNMITRKKKMSKPYIFIEAGIHAREWITPAVATFIAQELATLGKRFLKHATVILAPLANPDGYEYTHTNDRYWRKNRRTTAEPSCPGVDLNRNWRVGWGDPEGSSGDPCSAEYRGTESFSEPETQALRDLALVWMEKITLFVSLHCTGRVILLPWGFTSTPSSKQKQLARIAKVMTKYLHRNNQTFEFGQASHVMYTASGTSSDFMHGAGVKYSYTLELPEDSFELEPEKIIPISKAVWNSLICTLGEIVKTDGIRSFCKTKETTAKSRKKSSAKREREREKEKKKKT